MATLKRTSESDSEVTLFFSHAETVAICKAAQAQTKMRLQWILDVINEAVSRLGDNCCEHGVEDGVYCPECSRARQDAMDDPDNF